MSDESGERTWSSSAAAGGNQRLLAIGAFVGLAVALSSSVGFGRADHVRVPEDAVAMVNGKPLRRTTVARAGARVAADRKSAAEGISTDTIVKRLVEEELLVQRALAVGLVDADATVRSSLVRAMLDSIVLEAESETPSDADLRSFRRENAELFVPTSRYEVERIVFRDHEGGSTAAERAAAAAAALRSGEPFAAVRARFGDEPVMTLPGGALSPSELAEFLGPAAARRAARLAVADVTEPLASDEGLQVLRLRRSVPAPALSPETERAVVETAYRKNRVDEALREYLERLWRAADITIVRDRAG